MGIAAPGAIDVGRAIDEGPFTGFQVAAIVLCSLVGFLDGLDTQSIAVAAPLIVDHLGLARTALGPIFSSGLLGAALGALAFGPLGDRYGRRRLLILATAVFGLFTLATAAAASLPALIAVRFLAGVGLGGATPCFIALAAEYAPLRRRAMVASLIWASFPLGGTVGSFLNAYILADFGWRGLFLVGGVLPLLVAAALAVWLPESLRFLLASGVPSARVWSVLRRIRPDLPEGAPFARPAEAVRGVPIRDLFAAGRARQTLLLWVAFVTSFAVLAIVVLWTPALLRESGIAPSATAVVLGVHGIGALAGMGSAGRLIERFGPSPVLVPAFVVGAVVTAGLGFTTTSVPAASVAMALIGLTVGTGASGSIALATLVYPTAVRSSGVGWAMGMARLGQVLTPLLAAAMVGAGWNSGRLFLAFGAAPLVGALAVLMLRPVALKAAGAPRAAGRG